MNIKQATLALGAAIALSLGFGVATPAQAQTAFCVPWNPNNTSWPPTNSTLICTNSSRFIDMRSTLEAIGNDYSDAAERLKTMGTYAGDQVSITLFDDTDQQIIGTVGHITTLEDTPKIIAQKIAENVNTLYSTSLFASTQGNDVYIYSANGHMIHPLSHQSGTNGITLTVPTQTSNYAVSATVGGVARTDIKWWEFGSGADFFNCNPPLTGCPTDMRPSTLPTNSFGATWGSPNGGYTAVFEVLSGGTINNPIVKHTTAHETGHQLDYIYGQAGFGGSSGAPVSSTTAFKNAVQRDLDLMKLIPPCFYQASNGHNVFGDPPVRTGGVYAEQDENGAPLPSGGIAGFFSWTADANGNPICNDRESVVAGADVVEIAMNAYPYFGTILGTSPQAVAERERELFAEIYVALIAGGSGFPDTLDDQNNSNSSASDRLLLESEAFKCTRLYVWTLTQYGRMPTTDELSNTQYSIPGIISGAPVDNGMYGYGSTNFYCDGSSQYQGDYAWGS